MRKSIIAGLILWAVFAAFAGNVDAEVNYPWCIIGDTRAIDCYFTSREQCMQDGRNRGFGSQCIRNPAYKPGKPTVSVKEPTASQSTRLSQGVSAASLKTCTGLKSFCLSAGDICLTSGDSLASCESVCNFRWERCMKSGFWEGLRIHRSAERR
jgi:hypothetical protein